MVGELQRVAWVLAAHTGPYVVGTSHIDILLLQLKESSKSLLCRYCVFSVQHSSISIHSCIWELNLTFVYILCTQVQVHTVQHIQACRRGLVPALMPALISKEQWQCALVQRSRFVYKYISRAPAATPTDSARIYRSSFFLFPLRSKPASLQTSLRPSSL